jgi:hypothetical protein
MRRVISTIFLLGLLCGNAEAFLVGYSRGIAGPDVTDPELSTATANGTDRTLVFTEAVTADTTGELCSDWALTWTTAGADSSWTYASGDGTNTVHCAGVDVGYGDTVSDGLDYTPGTIVDLAGTPNALAAITSAAVTNNTPSDCATQSVLYSLTGTATGSSATIYVVNQNVVAFKITGTGKALYSITLITGATSVGGTSTAKLYLNTSLAFDSTNIDEQVITIPSGASTEFTITSTNQPVLTNGTDYYIAFDDPSGAYGTRFNFKTVADVANDNIYTSTTGLGGTFTPSASNSGLSAEVNVCD